MANGLCRPPALASRATLDLRHRRLAAFAGQESKADAGHPSLEVGDLPNSSQSTHAVRAESSISGDLPVARYTAASQSRLTRDFGAQTVIHACFSSQSTMLDESGFDGRNSGVVELAL